VLLVHLLLRTMSADSSLPLVLVLCTGNSCRSQIAESFLRAAAEGRFEVASAGSRPAGYVHPESIAVMAEVGHDLSGHRSKHLDEFRGRAVSVVLTVCGRADEACPTFPGRSRRRHVPFEDPAHAVGTPEEIRAEFRRVRDEIRAFCAAYAAGWADGSGEVGP
jgi:arsenate reductase (thioredoxin)